MEETITLYLGLKEGEKADFEIVGRAAAAFAEAVKEISYILEPSLEVRLEFDSGTEGSLKLKALLKSLNSADGRKAALISVVGTVGIMLVNDVRGYGTGKLIDAFLATDQRKELTDDDVARIARAVIDIRKGKIAKAPVQQMYKQLERDANIESVGAITKPDDKPSQPVPRSEFSERAGLVPPVETSVRTRTAPSTERLTLISPVLLVTERTWRFRSPIGEFGYVMKDEKFLDDLLRGRRHLGMKQGIQITAKIETKEEFEGGVWVPRHRDIIKVVRVHREPETEDLFAQPKKAKKAKTKSRKTKEP
ncbi:hypothetical protein AB7813_24555 [Tardiphaga sp. 20_F10_N6_6]|uniref:hypothetical protein n=1 Tax=Tardiphaga sp. 20_F10_N6_6 TaxID=3240788 RepID=UPI003F8B3B80